MSPPESRYRPAVLVAAGRADRQEIGHPPAAHALAIVDRLLAQGAKVRAHDPTVSGAKPGLPEAIEICSEPYEVCEGADVLAVLTEWDDYRWLDAGKAAAAMVGRAVEP